MANRCPICNGKSTRANSVEEQLITIATSFGKEAFYNLDAHTKCTDSTFNFKADETEYRHPTTIKLLRGPWIKRKIWKALEFLQC
jgi:hypothetical protein